MSTEHRSRAAVSAAPEYLGDGVYASFDGYMIGLTTGSDDAGVLVYLEPQVYAALRQYARRCWGAEPKP